MNVYFDFREINCPVCESSDRKLLGYRGGEAHQNNQGVKTSITRCKNCSHQYPNPMPFPKVDLGVLYSDPDEYFQNHELEEKKNNALGIMKDFETRLGNKGKILDVGCGRGELVWAAKESGWDAEGIDPSSEFVSYGKKNLGVNARVGTLEDAKFPSNSFDAITLCGIIEHLYTPFETLQEIHRILRPNGWLFFDAPNEDGLYMQFGNLYMRLLGRDWVVTLAPTFPPYHVQGFNPLSLRKIMDRASFSIESLEIVGGVCEQLGAKSFKKKLEFTAAKFVNSIGRAINKGSYMGVWAQKKVGE
jgi:2-polyprenyl-3-methyl-5-hydroxy-6-metoxy-1,4-benzoquinol methylase